MDTIKTTDNRTWENPYKVKEDVQEWIIDVAEEISNYNSNSQDTIYTDNVYDQICEIVDSSEYVIYNYQAKRITEVYEIDPFSKSEATGENYKSFNEMAYEVLNEMLTEYIINNYPEIQF